MTAIAACACRFEPSCSTPEGSSTVVPLASLLDSVLVPAIGVTVPPGSVYSTVDLHVQFVDSLVDEDAVAEGWIVRRGRRTVFGRARPGPPTRSG